MSRARKRVRHLWPCQDGYIAWRLFTGGLGVKTRALAEWMENEGQADELTEVNWQQMDLLTVPEDPQLKHRHHFWYLNHPEMGICAYDGPTKVQFIQTASRDLGHEEEPILT